MKQKPALFTSLVVLVAISLTQFSNRINTYPPDSPIQTASFFYQHSQIDTFDFDEEELDKIMENLRTELEVLKNKKIKIGFNSEKLKEEMEKLSTELANQRMEDFNFEFDFDIEEFKQSMEELAEELKNQKLSFHQDSDFSMTELKKEMEALKEKIKDIKIDVKGLKVEIKKFDEFIKEVRKEMVNDGLIDRENEDINFELNKNEMNVNGKKVSEDLFRKYKGVYKKIFSKEPDEDVKINSN